MSQARRAADEPPQIDGFVFRQVLGVGGFSTVFLYEQLRPRREVAVKVLVAEGISDAGRRRFESEANLMAELSAHPYIVTIYDAGIASDGRPYLIMEYYPGPHLGSRSRNERMGVAEVLQVAVQVASAVETAHRAGIIHRDIKPANVLTSRYHKPGLTDFGISVGAGEDDDEGGMSVPWSSPEAFDPNGVLDRRSDVYSLGALTYNLLAGRSPFEVPGTRNSQAELISRIERSLPQPTGRDDVPPDLESVLAQTMAKRADLRPASALAFARSMQAIEQDLSLPPTHIDVLEKAADRSEPVDYDEELAATQYRGTTSPGRMGDQSAPLHLVDLDATSGAEEIEATSKLVRPNVSGAQAAFAGGLACPVCGVLGDPSLRFCVACGAAMNFPSVSAPSDQERDEASDVAEGVVAVGEAPPEPAGAPASAGTGGASGGGGDIPRLERSGSGKPLPSPQEYTRSRGPAIALAVVGLVLAMIAVVVVLRVTSSGGDQEAPRPPVVTSEPPSPPDDPSEPPSPPEPVYSVRVTPLDKTRKPETYTGTLEFSIAACRGQNKDATDREFNAAIQGAGLATGSLGDWQWVRDDKGVPLKPTVTRRGGCPDADDALVSFTAVATVPSADQVGAGWSEPVTYSILFPTSDGGPLVSQPRQVQRKLIEPSKVSTIAVQQES